LAKGGILVEFTGGGFEYERFLIRTDGKVPNSRYETKKIADHRPVTSEKYSISFPPGLCKRLHK
jgi:hypothetical protein